MAPFQLRLSAWGIVLGIIVAAASGKMLRAQEPLVDSSARETESVSKTDLAEARPAIEALFASLRHAYDVGDPDTIVAYYDVERMYDKINAGVPATLPGARLGSAEFSDFSDGFARGITARTSELRWKTHHITKVTKAHVADEVIACVRHKWHNDRVMIGRYWLRQTAEGWRIADFEFVLEDDIRATESGRIALLSQHDPASQKGLYLLRDAQFLHNNDQPLDALQRLAAVPADASRQVQAVRWILVALIHLDFNDIRVARAAFERATATRIADLCALEALEGLVLLADEKYDVAAQRFKSLLERLGPQQEFLYLYGSALASAGRSAEAIDAFRRALAGPKELFDEEIAVRTTLELGLLLPSGDKQEIATHFAKLPDPAFAFEFLADNFLAAADEEALVLVIEAGRKYDANSTPVTYYQAKLQHAHKEFESAATLLEPLLAIEQKETRYVDAYLLAMNQMGQAIEAYAKTPNRTYAFYRLAQELLATSQSEQLLELARLHGQTDPNDAWVDYYTGVAHTLKGEVARAKEVYMSAQLKAQDDKVREAIRGALVRTWFDLDEGLAAYRSVAPLKQAFEQLAYLYANAQRSVDLAALVELHGRAAADDPDLPLWRAEVEWWNGRYAAAAAAIESNWARAAVDANRLTFFENRLVRALLRKENSETAQEKAAESTVRDGDPYFQVIVDATLGNVADAIGAFKICVDEFGYDAQYFYNDEDAGAALRSADYSSLHKLYPPAKGD